MPLKQIWKTDTKMILLRGAALQLGSHKQKLNQALGLLFPAPFGTIPGSYHQRWDSLLYKWKAKKGDNVLFSASLVGGKEEKNLAEQLHLLFLSPLEQFCQAARFPSVSFVFVIFLSN